MCFDLTLEWGLVYHNSQCSKLSYFAFTLLATRNTEFLSSDSSCRMESNHKDLGKSSKNLHVKAEITEC